MGFTFPGRFCDGSCTLLSRNSLMVRSNYRDKNRELLSSLGIFPYLPWAVISPRQSGEQQAVDPFAEYVCLPILFSSFWVVAHCWTSQSLRLWTLHANNTKVARWNKVASSISCFQVQRYSHHCSDAIRSPLAQRSCAPMRAGNAVGWHRHLLSDHVLRSVCLEW